MVPRACSASRSACCSPRPPGASPTSSGSRPRPSHRRVRRPDARGPAARATGTARDLRRRPTVEVEPGSDDHRRPRDARRAAPHQDRRHDRPRQPLDRDDGGAHPRRGRRLPAQLLPRHPRRPRGERRHGAGGGGARRARGRPARRPARARSSGSASSKAASSTSREGSELTLTTDGGWAAADHLPVTWEGLPGGGPRGQRGLPRRRADPAARPRSRRPTRSAARSRWAAASPRTRASTCRAPTSRSPRRARPTSAGSTSRSSTGSICSRSRSSAAPRTCMPVERRVRVSRADIPLIAKIEKPQAAENAEAIIRAALGRDHGRPRRPRASSCRSSAVPAVQKRLLALAGERSKPSITATQMLASMVTSTAPHPSRGHRRRQRDLAGHRRRDALRGDGDRRLPGGGRAGDGPDRARDRARPALRRLGLQPRRRRRVRRLELGGPRRGRLHLHARPRGPGRPDPRAAAPPAWSQRTAPRSPCSRSRRGSRRCGG